MATPKHPYEYGRSPHPRTWHETADAIKSVSKPKKRVSGIIQRLELLEKFIKSEGGK